VPLSRSGARIHQQDASGWRPLVDASTRKIKPPEGDGDNFAKRHRVRWLRLKVSVPVN